MASERGIREISFDPGTWDWELPAAARRRLDGFAQAAGIDHLGRGRPLPNRYSNEILGQLLHHLFPDGTTAQLPENARTLRLVQQEYLAGLVFSARRALDTRQREAPATLLGFPPDIRGRWANLLSASWIPFQEGWFGVVKS